MGDDGVEVRLALQGLTDIHCHGALGAEFGNDADGSIRAAAHHRETGTQTVIASLVSASPEVLERRVTTLGTLVRAGVIGGIHLEGPFLALGRAGAHDHGALALPDAALVTRLAEASADAGAPGALKHWTFAPELPGTDDLVRALADHGILPAIGHTDGTADDVERTLGLVTALTGREGLITHLFNAMPPLHHRAGGPVAAALSAASRGEAVVELITDGVHVSPEVVRFVFDTIGPDRIALVSDAMTATGLGAGDYRLGSLDVRVDAGVARVRLPEGGVGAIAGSTAALADCVRWAVEVARVPFEDAMRAATLTPQRVLGGSAAAA